MALRAWIDRLRGKGEAPPAEDEAPPPEEQALAEPLQAEVEAPAAEAPAETLEAVEAEPVPDEAEPVAEAVIEAEPPPAAEPEAPRIGWLARLRGTPAPEPEPEPVVTEPEPEAASPSSEAQAGPPGPEAEPDAPRGGWLTRLRGAPEPEPEPAPEPESRGGWFSRLKQGLSRSTAKLTDSVTALFNKRRLDDAALEELEETLITADLGVAAAARIVEGFRKTRFGKEVTDEEVKAALAEEIAAILDPVAQPMEIDPTRAPHVVLVVGVNGTGKTTTIAKLGQQYRAQGLSCGFVAGDTFRAAAVEQLQIWGERTGAHVYVPAKDGADAAGLAFDALTAARQAGTQVLLVDTAGRLHNKSALMEELRKIVRVIQRVDPTAPHSVLLTLDATTGQNAIQQCKVFGEMVDVTGLAVTKLDGSAKGGVVVALAQEFGLPVHMVGVGEKADDLRPFTARDYARGLVGLD